MPFWTRFLRWSCNLNSLPLGLDKWLFRLPTGWKLSFGVWIRCTVDEPEAPLSLTLKDGSSNYLHTLLSRDGQVRLLKLHPGSPGEPLRCSLEPVKLCEAPAYEALSYVWGPDEKQASVSVDGQKLRITENLHQALLDLRTPNSSRMLWIDAICINQCDTKEKARQVEMMDEIYRQATSVVAHLGSPTEDTETDMQNLRSFLKQHAHGEEAPWSHIPIPELEQSVGRILARPWFHRMWTVQEAVLAQHITLQCGSHKIQWASDLRILRALVFRIKSAVVSPIYSLHERSSSELDWTPLLYILESQMRQAARREGVVLQRNLLDVAFDFRHRQSSMPHDRYYAILGIIEKDQGGSRLMDVDYSVPVEEVYERFRAEIQRLGEIEDVLLA